MKYVVNGRFLTQRTTGVQRFAYEIINEIAKTQAILILVPKNVPLLRDVTMDNNILLQKMGCLKGHLWEQIDLPTWLKKNGRPMLLNLCNTAPLSYSKNIIVIHDLAVFENSNWFSFKFRVLYKFLVPRVVKSAKMILTVSNTVAGQLKRTFPFIEEVFVIYNAAGDIFQSVGRTKKKKIILTVGSIDPRKNLQTLIDAFKLSNLENYSLVIVGEQNSNFGSTVATGNFDSIIFTGRIDDEQLINYYNDAELFVYLSFYEGFGIPPLEAQKCGLPILLSDIEVFREIYGDSALFCDPQNVLDVTKKVKEVISNKVLKEQMKTLSLENAKGYNWRHSASNLLDRINSIDHK